MRNAPNGPAKNIDDYLLELPENVKSTLQKLREQIIMAAPKAEEVISYGIPSFKLNGMLVGFGAAKKHAALYVMSYAVMAAFKKELAGLDTATSTIRFAFDKPLPATLVKKIVKARMKENEEKLKAKAKPAAKKKLNARN